MNANTLFGFRKSVTGLLCGIAVFSSASIAYAQSWVAIPSPTTQTLFGMDCGTSSVCVAVGMNGAVIRTTDHKTWTTGTSGTTAAIVGVDMYSATVGIAVGASGLILKTIDGGATWSSVTGITTETLYSVSMATSSIAYITGTNGVAFKTTDGGATWSDISSGLGGTSMYSIDAYSSSTVYVAGANGVAYKTTNSGAAWTALTTGTTESIYAVDAMSTTIAFIGGTSGLVKKTTDGATFIAQTLSGFGSGEAVVDLSCTTSSLCLVSGGQGTVNITGNGGSTWTEETMPSAAQLGGAANFAVGRRFVVGANGVIFALDAYGPAAVGSLALSTGGTSTTDTTPEFTWTDSTDNESSIASYAIDVDSSGTYTNMGDVNTYALTAALSAGSHTVTVIAVDAAGNNGTTSSLTFTVSTTSSDTTAPTVGSVTPTSVVVDETIELVATYSDDIAVTSCTLFDGGSPYAMTLNSGRATYSTTFGSTGSHSMYVLCGDAAGNTGTGATATVTVVSSGADTTAPVVSSITPVTATVGVVASLSASVTESVGVSSCYLYVGGVSQGAMTMTTGMATRSYTPSAAGTLSAYAVCTDTSGNIGTGSTTSITVSAASTDTTAPTVGTPSPLTAVAGSAKTFSVSYSDDVGVVSCTMHTDDGTVAMALSSGTASVSAMFDTAGSYTGYATCLDAAGNTGTGATATVVVSVASTDATGPTVGSVTPTTATQNTATTFSVTATDASGIYGCYLMVDGNAQGAMTALSSTSSTYTRSYTSASSGTLSVYAWCGDVIGNVGTGSTTTVTVAAAAATTTDRVAPTVGAITPLTATEDTAVRLYASVADSGGMGTCTLYVNSTNIGSMTISGGYASRSYTFTAAGDAVANAYCVDAAGNATRGASSTITVSAAVSEEEGTAVNEADIGTLIKLACGTSPDAEDPCHAVYYYDGKRHAFPNEKVYLTWYSNFDDVIVVTEDFLSSTVLGLNVTYHPGTTMVKFITVNTVYAVGEAGELRGIASEEVAKSIWGSDWNTQIDDISDAFHGNYTFGDDINSTSDFDPDAVEASVTDIADILQ
ncbi:MAG: YCF48-related protein [Patescibacteria group bacterium]